MKFTKTAFWSDSTTVLNWINSATITLPTFVANRVADIQSTTQPEDWHHVRTHDNPADFVSRGQSPLELNSNQLWMSGPEWLIKDESCWPKFNFKTSQVTEPDTSHSNVTLKIALSEDKLWDKYMSFRKLLIVTAYCLRFINNTRVKDLNARIKGKLSPTDLILARDVIIKQVQAKAFSKELLALQQNTGLEKTSSLLCLNPFLEQEIIKVGGRLTQSSLPESQKYPIVLPRNHKMTRMIILDEHLNKCHAGVNATLYGVPETYWPLDGRNTVRHIVKQCIPCFRVKPRDLTYIIGNLPKKRVTFARPFLHVGVDYCGPFFIKEHRHRNRTKLKTYVSIFVCLATKAVHLELASDLTTEAFVASLKRFFASSMHSDNGTNFVGASKEIKDLFQMIKKFERDEEIKQYLLKNEVNWHFIPPRAFGGLWEAGVKSFKNHFVRIAGNSLLTYEQLLTYVVQIEAILNSRPLTPLSSDPNDLLPLTPGHFLTGSSLTNLSEGDLRNLPISRLSCWQLAQQMQQHFWERWHKEYLNEMTTRSKWKKDTDQANISVGRMVIVKEKNLPPMVWKLARITAVHPGKDGVILTVTIQTSTGAFKRPLKKLCLLPIE